ncbi:acyl-CoA dehydrogenase family protein [Nevskia sp.]|uniref:acyl-CoA dehydrogenase family protein n=1 Tax=Nevskia sp. TaxID=1929292 RepID=UPI0025D74BD3|nr:acyl-CoA dehydrogenase family protein [Nevskia sp.]
MSFDLRFSAEQLALKASARAFARETLSTVAAASLHLATPEARFAATRPMYEAAIRAGFLRRLIPMPFGGGGSGVMDMAIVAEEFHAIDVNVSLTLFANLLGLMPLFIAGTPEQQQRHIAPFLAISGEPLAALANSEPGGSANFASTAVGGGTRTVAVRAGGDWLISGSKQWVSSATGWDGRGADLLCVVCCTDPDAPPEQRLSVLLVPKPERGLSTEACPETLGHRAHLTPRFHFDQVRVPADHVVGGVGGGKALVEASFSGTAALVGIMAVGVARAAFDFALNFARTETRGGAVPIIDHQAVGYALADAKTAIEAARSLGWRACAAVDAQAPDALELSLHSKIFGSETAVRVITDLMRVVGIDSYDHALPLAGLLQDALALPLFDGGNMGVRRRQLHELLRSANFA